MKRYIRSDLNIVAAKKERKSFCDKYDDYEDVLFDKSIPQSEKELVCQELSEKKNYNYRYLAASCTEDPKLIEKLSNDPYYMVRYEIAVRTIGTAYTKKFMTDPHKIVRGAVAERTDDSSILTALAHDRDASVRANVARNANIPQLLLEKLAHDRIEYVRRWAEETLSNK